MKAKNLLAIVVVALFAISCSNKRQTENKDKPTQVEASTAIDVQLPMSTICMVNNDVKHVLQ